MTTVSSLWLTTQFAKVPSRPLRPCRTLFASAPNATRTVAPICAYRSRPTPRAGLASFLGLDCFTPSRRELPPSLEGGMRGLPALPSFRQQRLILRPISFKPPRMMWSGWRLAARGTASLAPVSVDLPCFDLLLTRAPLTICASLHHRRCCSPHFRASWIN